MEKVRILNTLEELNKELYSTNLKFLIEELKEDIRLETSYKSNSRSKINAIKRVCRTQAKTRPILSGYSIYDDKYIFTDSYQVYCINPIDMPIKRVGEQTEEEKHNGIETIPGKYPDVKRILKPMNYDELVELDLNDIMYHYKIRKAKDINSCKYELKSNNLTAIVDINYLKTAIDILGKDVRCSLYKAGSYNHIIFENDKKECGLMLPIING